MMNYINEVVLEDNGLPNFSLLQLRYISGSNSIHNHHFIFVSINIPVFPINAALA